MEGYHVTDFGYVAQLHNAAGQLIAAAPMSIDAVTRGHACDTRGDAACFMMNIALTFAADSLNDGAADGKLSLCMASDLTAKPEGATCRSMPHTSGNANRRWEYIDLPVSYNIKDRQIEITKYDGMPGDPKGENILLLFHPAFAFAAPGACEVDLRSPLVLDLSGNGKLDLISAKAQGETGSITFDWNGNGKRVSTGWVAGGDGFLVIDAAKPDLNGRELFGEFTKRLDGKQKSSKNFANGFDALAQLDANGDGRIDAGDPGFSRLKVWIDRNQNGRAESDELQTLSVAGIAKLSLAKASVDEGSRRDPSGNEIWLRGSYTTKDGKDHLIADVWFKSRSGVDVSARAAGLVKGVRP